MNIIKIVDKLNSFLWENLLIFLLLGTGIYYSFRLRFPQIRQIKAINEHVFGKVLKRGDKADADGMTSFQALATALAAQVGTGNLAGVATAIASGGPGAIFWMWISAFFGMGTIFGEAILAQKYVERIDGEVVGGPAYYLRKGVNSKFLAGFFAVSIIIALGFIGNMVQSNSIAIALNSAFDIPSWIGGAIAAVLAGLILVGGISRIASFTELIVPIMAILYIAGSMVIIVLNYNQIIPAFKTIFNSAFSPEAAVGGVLGATVKEAVRYGISRGLFSNEAGMGSTPHAHAVAKVDHPAEQGLVAIFGVIFDTLIICTITALINIITGAYTQGVTGIAMTQTAYKIGLGSFGTKFIAVSLFFFAFSTIIGWYYFGESNIKYLFGKEGIKYYRVIVLLFILLGSILDVDLVWKVADLFNGLMVLPNIVGLLILSPQVFAALRDYENNFLNMPK
ncbi:alanine/glycine:cation symporter family protein [Clostridium sp. Cult3]|uniref:alanine/glycine:cation symporter family protein n=1 Tax=Clostridium sp. Cult3 TaxID=2079004 RepID=UPI001F307C2D|nr:sodium:alanine symporter family protein [Clostridium sp. Cult3]MCF6461583.1 sodium:alanine symporter family protein [Clostridium sp. Cult3]